MQQKLLAGLAMALTLNFGGDAAASLVTIGTARYNGGDYNLIWDDDNNGQSIVWLDYAQNGMSNWQDIVNWAAGLESSLIVNLVSGYSVTWDSAWRLPNTVDGQFVESPFGNTTAGYNITSSEMGHLFYVELGNNGYQNPDGSYNPTTEPPWNLTNTGGFANLIPSWYWSGTEYASQKWWPNAYGEAAWVFIMHSGRQDIHLEDAVSYGMAVRAGQVMRAEPLPEPGTLALLAIGLTGLGYSRRKQ